MLVFEVLREGEAIFSAICRDANDHEIITPLSEAELAAFRSTNPREVLGAVLNGTYIYARREGKSHHIVRFKNRWDQNLRDYARLLEGETGLWARVKETTGWTR